MYNHPCKLFLSKCGCGWCGCLDPSRNLKLSIYLFASFTPPPSLVGFLWGPMLQSSKIPVHFAEPQAEKTSSSTNLHHWPKKNCSIGVKSFRSCPQIPQLNGSDAGGNHGWSTSPPQNVTPSGIRAYQRLIIKPLIRPCFWVGTLGRGVVLTSHNGTPFFFQSTGCLHNHGSCELHATGLCVMVLGLYHLAAGTLRVEPSDNTQQTHTEIRKFGHTFF